MKKAIGNYLLGKKLKHLVREKQFKGIHQSNTVGIIFDASSSSDNVIINKLSKELKQLGKDIKILGYVNYRDKDPRYISDASNIFISKKDFNWFNMPKESMIDDFIANQFDILIVLTNEDLFPIKYTSALSTAHFKVGRMGLWDNHFDLLMEFPAITPFEEQTSQIMHYLKLISQ